VHKEINLAAERIFNALTHVSCVNSVGIDRGPIYSYLVSIRERDALVTDEEKPLILGIIAAELHRFAERIELCNCDGDGPHVAHD
jgi:hypothetical protein